MGPDAGVAAVYAVAGVVLAVRGEGRAGAVGGWQQRVHGGVRRVGGVSGAGDGPDAGEPPAGDFVGGGGNIVERVVARRLDGARFDALKRIGVAEFSYRPICRRAPGPRCDRVLFRLGPAPYRLIAAPIELKSGTVDASEVAGQLQQGIEFVKRFAPPDAQLTCRPILIHGQCFRGGPRECARTTTERPVVERILPAKYTAVPQTIK